MQDYSSAEIVLNDHQNENNQFKAVTNSTINNNFNEGTTFRYEMVDGEYRQINISINNAKNNILLTPSTQKIFKTDRRHNENTKQITFRLSNTDIDQSLNRNNSINKKMVQSNRENKSSNKFTTPHHNLESSCVSSISS